MRNCNCFNQIYLFTGFFGLGLLIPKERFRIKRGKELTVLGILCICAFAFIGVTLLINDSGIYIQQIQVYQMNI